MFLILLLDAPLMSDFTPNDQATEVHEWSWKLPCRAPGGADVGLEGLAEAIRVELMRVERLDQGMESKLNKPLDCWS